MNIKCRKAGIAPTAVVLVATVRAMKMNGGVAKPTWGLRMSRLFKMAAPTLDGISRT